MYRRSVVKSLFKGSTPSALGIPAPAIQSPFYLTKFKEKMITGGTHDWSMLLKSRRLYSSTDSQQPASSASLASIGLVREEFLELPLPGPVKYIERSTPMITKSELDKYFYPLFCRGWEIKRLPEANVNFSDPSHASPFLVHKFRFKGNRTARAFLQEIFRIESEEKHHISFNLWSEKRPVITVKTQTHSARRFDQIIESDPVTINVVEPGLTLRDIRIAVLLENLLNSPNNLIAKIPDSDVYVNSGRAAAWQTLLSQYPFTN